MTQSPRSAASTFRKIIAVIILVPLAMLIIALAVANRQLVTVSLDPFNPSQPAYTTQPIWLFVPIFAALIVGVAVGGFVAWLRHSKWRRIARRYEREAIALRGEIALLQHREPPLVPSQRPPAERLQLKPPVR